MGELFIHPRLGVAALREKEHRAQPVWYDHRDNIICKECRQPLLGDGTMKNPWRHPGEPIEMGVRG